MHMYIDCQAVTTNMHSVYNIRNALYVNSCYLHFQIWYIRWSALSIKFSYMAGYYIFKWRTLRGLIE